MATTNTNDNGASAGSERRDTYDTMLAMLPRVQKQNATTADRDTYRALLEREHGLWRATGDLARATQDKLLASMNAPASITEALKVGIAEMRQELRGDDEPRLIKLLVEQVLVCWLQMYQTHYSYAAVMGDDHSFAKGAYWERRLTATQGRYLRAIDTLARVRRLALPVQVNIATNGGQQVNVAGGTSSMADHK